MHSLSEDRYTQTQVVLGDNAVIDLEQDDEFTFTELFDHWAKVTLTRDDQEVYTRDGFFDANDGSIYYLLPDESAAIRLMPDAADGFQIRFSSAPGAEEDSGTTTDPGGHQG